MTYADGPRTTARFPSRLVQHYVRQTYVAKKSTRVAVFSGRVGRSFHGSANLLLHIGKTGGTSLARAVEEARATSDGHRSGSLPIKLTHKGSRSAMRDRNLDRCAFAFVFRDPVERYASAFLETLRQGRPHRSLGKVPWSAGVSAAYRWFAEPNDLFEALSSRDDRVLSAAVTAFHEIPLLRMDHVWTLGTREEFAKSERRIYCMSPLRDLEERFTSFLYPRGTGPGSRDATVLPSLRSTPDTPPVLSETAIRNLRRYRAQEFDLIDRLEQVYAERFG